MSNPKLIASLVVCLLAPALAGCEDPREYDLTLDPYLFLEEATPDYVRFSWDTYEDATELRVERKPPGEQFSVYTKLPPTVKEYTDDTVVAGAIYKYRLRGMFRNGGTHRSVILKVEVPDEPDPVPLTVVSSAEGIVSPDGTRSARVLDDRVWITEFPTGLRRPATRGELGPESDVAWMSDSRRLLIVAGPIDARRIYLYDPDSHDGSGQGGSLVLVEDATDPEVSADGRTLTFVAAGVTHTMSLEPWVEGR